MGVGGQRHAPERHPVPIVQEAGWAPGPVWTGTENLAPTRIRSSDPPARSESLYRLRCSGPVTLCMSHKLVRNSTNEAIISYVMQLHHTKLALALLVMQMLYWLPGKQNHMKPYTAPSIRNANKSHTYPQYYVQLKPTDMCSVHCVLYIPMAPAAANERENLL
jgi:hypothetical protein